MTKFKTTSVCAAMAMFSAVSVSHGAGDDAIKEAIQVLPDRQPVELSYDVVNTDRNIGTRLSGRIAEIHGDRGFNGRRSSPGRLTPHRTPHASNSTTQQSDKTWPTPPHTTPPTTPTTTSRRG
jgi:hypothetical protein